MGYNDVKEHVFYERWYKKATAPHRSGVSVGLKMDTPWIQPSSAKQWFFITLHFVPTPSTSQWDRIPCAWKHIVIDSCKGSSRCCWWTRFYRPEIDGFWRTNTIPGFSVASGLKWGERGTKRIRPMGYHSDTNRQMHGQRIPISVSKPIWKHRLPTAQVFIADRHNTSSVAFHNGRGPRERLWYLLLNTNLQQTQLGWDWHGQGVYAKHSLLMSGRSPGSDIWHGLALLRLLFLHPGFWINMAGILMNLVFGNSQHNGSIWRYWRIVLWMVEVQWKSCMSKELMSRAVYRDNISEIASLYLWKPFSNFWNFASFKILRPRIWEIFWGKTYSLQVIYACELHSKTFLLMQEISFSESSDCYGGSKEPCPWIVRVLMQPLPRNKMDTNLRGIVSPPSGVMR